MSVKLADIAEFFLKKITLSPKFDSTDLNSDQSLLFPAFLVSVRRIVESFESFSSFAQRGWGRKSRPFSQRWQ